AGVPARGGDLGVIIGAGFTARTRGRLVAARPDGRIIPVRGGDLGVIIGAGFTARTRGRLVAARPGRQGASIAAGRDDGPPLRSAITGLPASARGFGSIIGTAGPARAGDSIVAARSGGYVIPARRPAMHIIPV